MEKETVEINHYWALEQSVSWGFNRLKAKLFNLVEASVVDKGQVEALKGLIKGFANDEYKNVVEELRMTAIGMKLLDAKEPFLPQTAEPLEAEHLR